MAPEPGIGDIVAGYRLDSVVARGGMGTIYRATHERLGTTFALKVLRPELASDPQFRSRFELEARLLAQFHHPNVVQVTNAGEDAGILYMVTTYLEGYALTDLILRAGRLDPALVLDYVSQIASALDAAHESGLVHRDVKPSNILITSASASDPGGKAYLVDFGIAKDVANAGKLTEYGAFVGSRHYASPEQINARPLDGRADQYSLACVFFEAVTGHVPYDRGSEAAVIVAHLTEAPPSLAADRPDLPAALDKALAKALSKDPAERYPTCAAMVEALEQAAGASGEASSAELAELAPGVITAAGKTEVGAGREPPIELPPDMPPPIPAGHETEVGIAQGGPPPQETPDSPAGGDSGGTEVVSRGTPPVEPEWAPPTVPPGDAGAGGRRAGLPPSRVLAAAGVAALVLIAVLAFVLTSGGSDTAGGGSSNGSSGGGGSGGKPTAVPDTLTAGPTPTTFSADALTSNDTDPDGGGLKLVEATPTDGTKGMVGFSDGQVTYHAGGFVGTDTFSYVVEDGSGDRATGQATVVVSADGGGGSDVTFSPSQQYLLDHMPAQLANTCKPVKTADQYFKADVGAQGAVFCSPTNSGISSVTYFKFRTPGLAEASFSDFFNGYPTGLASDCKSKYSNKSTWKYKGVRGQVGCYHTSAPNFELDWTYTTFPIYGVVTGNTRCATCQANVYTWWVRQPNP